MKLTVSALYPNIADTRSPFLCPIEQFLIENQQSATDDRYGACLYVGSKMDGDRIKVTGCNETDERQNWAYTLKGQIQVCKLALGLYRTRRVDNRAFQTKKKPELLSSACQSYI